MPRTLVLKEHFWISRMRRVFTLVFSIVFVSAVSLATQAPQKKTSARKKAQKPAEVTTEKIVEAMPTQPPPPPPPPTPEQGPSSPPEVSYQAGQLVIVARNSTMGDVLNAVKQKTGAAVEMPSSSSERVVGKFGPGAPRDVMAQLLNGSHYDYVLLGSPADPGALKKVVLMARVNGPQPNGPQQAQQQVPPGANPGFQNPAYQQQNLQAVPEVENDQPVEEASPDNAQDVQQPEEEQPPTADQGAADQSQPNQQPTVKTPEQLLRELQQQQQQQQQQDQNGQPGPPQ
jgi:hypothetical protein